MNLYEMNAEINEVIMAMMEGVDEETGEVDAGLAARLDALQAERSEKIENIALWVKQLTAEGAAIKAEEDALKARRTSKEKMVARLKDYVASALQADGRAKFETARVALSFRRSEVVEVDMAKLPAEYQKTKTEISADKTAIKDALKKGETIDGAWLVERQNLQIK